MAATTGVVWGRADDGAVIQAAIPEEPGAAEQLARIWPPLALALVPDDPGVPAAQESPSFAGWERLESDLTLFAAERIAGRVAVHAGVLALEGRVVVLPGSSLSGKSTLCAAAQARGLTVLSDEYALIDPRTGLIEGWPRPIRLRVGSGGWSPSRLPVARSAPLPAALVAALAYDPGTHQVPLARLSPAEVVLTVLAHAVCAQTRPHEAFSAALAVSRTAQGVSGTRGDADAALDAMLTQLVTLQGDIP